MSRETIISGAARAIWAQWWADQCTCGRNDYETCRLRKRQPQGYELRHQPLVGSGVEVMDIVPPTPPDALAKAEALIGGIERANARPIESLCLMGHYATEPRLFGHYAAMQALGHGVGLGDDGPGYRGVRVPYIEYQGLSIHPQAEPGYAFGSSKRYPRAPETQVMDRDDLGRYTWVGTAVIDGTTCNAWRLRGPQEPMGALTRLSRYIFQTR